MDLTGLYNEQFKSHAKLKEVADSLKDGNNVNLDGLHASARSLVLSALLDELRSVMLIVANDQDTAAYLYSDMSHVKGADKVFYFPSSYKHNIKGMAADPVNEVLRTDVLNRLADDNNGGIAVVTYPEALIEKVITSQALKEKILTLHQGEEISQQSVVELLLDNGFKRVDFVYEPGQFSVRGSILDVFSFTSELPLRVDFFGDEVDSIRLFNVETQLSEEVRETVSIAPDIRQCAEHENNYVSLLQFVDRQSVFVFEDILYSGGLIDNIYNSHLSVKNLGVDTSENELKKMFVSGDEFLENIKDFRKVELNHSLHIKDSRRITFHTSPQPLFHKNFDLMAESFDKFLAEGYRIFITSDSLKQTDRIKAIFDDKGHDITFTPVLHTLHGGFVDADVRLCVFTDHEIFDRFHRYQLKSDKARNGRVALTLKELNQFQIGDYVTHIDHGVGRFAGLFKMDVNGRKQEMIKLVYQNSDTIYVNINSLHRIAKYKGKDGTPPKVDRLGSGAWERLKERTKKKVKDIARDLIRLYAKRKAEKGFAFSRDTYMQKELEASFLYEDTPDQMKATKDVKADMEKSLPMDRLVCGDVGFGKTEIAMRAAFKAVADNKQVAVLVPTTVLALQHYNSFCKRLKNFPCTVEYLSRARSAAQTKEILKRLEEGKIDIIIGTHKLVGKNVKFRDLGLLIIDEEQKFGVSVKEKLKALKVNVDTLTMTATPIPRTLQFSLLGARDLSIISTPPPNRYPVQTELVEFDADVIREAVEREIGRNGQVFIINNRIGNIYELEAMVRAAVPKARIVVGHGQMEADKLEQIILDFIDYEYDVLIATTIIESGIDIPNANTIIINNAQNYGLSDLHQLRGRVGRSNKKAYCYLMTPPLSSLTPDARRRLQAIETFADLGCGFQIAMQDLDIRGAGNMLGAEQSGFIADLGYETYQKILAEAVQELKDDEFADLYKEEETTEPDRLYVADCQLDTDMQMMIPSDYVENVSERMSLYRELDNFTGDEQIEDFRKRMVDRFGPLPQAVSDLFVALRLRWLAQRLGFERLVLKGGKMICYMISSPSSVYFRSQVFGAVLSYVASNPMRCRLKEDNDKRSVAIANVGCMDDAYKILQAMQSMIVADRQA